MRFTIGRMMIVVAVSACLFASWRWIGWATLVWLGLVPWFFYYLAGRGQPDLSGWIFAVIAAVCSLSIATISAFVLGVLGGVLMFLTAVFTVPATFVSGLAWVTAATSAGSPRRRSARFAVSVFLGSVFLPLSMCFTLWPLRLAFLVSRPALDRLADRVVAGGPIAWPQRAGLYRLIDAKHDAVNGNVALIVDPNPSGNSGFMRMPSSESTQVYGPLYNFSYNLRIDGRWWYQEED